MRRLLLAIGALTALHTAANAQSVADFYKGKTIRMVVGIDVGSGYDVNARLLARHLVNHIPGNPAIVVQNQPGAGSATMTAQLYNTGPFDGTVIGAAFAGMPTLPAARAGRASASIRPSSTGSATPTAKPTSPTCGTRRRCSRFDEVRTKELIMGAQAPGSSQVDFPLVANALFGLKHKVITGYGSTAKINLAMESGEVQGAIAALTTVRTLSSQWLDREEDQDHHAMGAAHESRSARRPERARPRQDRRGQGGAQLVMARLDIGRPFFLPPNVPADRVAALRAAFDATMKDPAYLAEAKKLKIDVDPMNAADLTAFVAQVAKTPADTVARVRKALETKSSK